MATDHEISHGRAIRWTLRAKQAPTHIAESWIGTSWIVEVAASGSRNGEPFQATRLCLTSLRTTPEAPPQLVRDRWSIEGWHWIRDTQLDEDSQRAGGGDRDPAAAARGPRAGQGFRLKGLGAGTQPPIPWGLPPCSPSAWRCLHIRSCRS